MSHQNEEQEQLELARKFARSRREALRELAQGVQKPTMDELLKASDYSQPQPAQEREWVDAPSVGDEWKSETLKIPDLNEVFAALDTDKLPNDFMCDANRDRRPAQDRPELGPAIGPTTKAAMEEARAERLDSFGSVEALMTTLNAEDSGTEQTPEPPVGRI